MGSAKFTRSLPLQTIAERRAAKRYPNMTIRNSYHVFQDGTNHWYEVILIDQNRRGLEQPEFRHRASSRPTPSRHAPRPLEDDAEDSN